jgi:hypothetical protein
MRRGHVAVVTLVSGPRQVLIEHANWAPPRSASRGKIAKMIAVLDISPANDWTEVRVWNAASQDFGTRVYPIYGFIYPHVPVRQARAAKAAQAAPAEPTPLISPAVATPARLAGFPVAEAVLNTPAAASAAADAVWEEDVEAARRAGSGRY